MQIRHPQMQPEEDSSLFNVRGSLSWCVSSRTFQADRGRPIARTLAVIQTYHERLVSCGSGRHYRHLVFEPGNLVLEQYIASLHLSLSTWNRLENLNIMTLTYTDVVFLGTVCMCRLNHWPRVSFVLRNIQHHAHCNEIHQDFFLVHTVLSNFLWIQGAKMQQYKCCVDKKWL